jgi:hypothetical protein
LICVTANNPNRIRQRPQLADLIIPPGPNDPAPAALPEGNRIHPRPEIPEPLFGNAERGSPEVRRPRPPVPRYLFGQPDPSATKAFLDAQEAARNLPPLPAFEQPSRHRSLFGAADNAGIQDFLQTKEMEQTQRLLRGFTSGDRPATPRPNSNDGGAVQRPAIPNDLFSVDPNSLSVSAAGPRGFGGSAGAGPSAPRQPPMSPPPQAQQAAAEGQVARHAVESFENRRARMAEELGAFFASGAKKFHL